MKNLARRFGNSAIPLALKWSLLLACFVSLVMGLLGWFLINQQESAYRFQGEELGRMVTDQLARASSEPLLAGDTLPLQVLVSQQEKNDLILGMQVFDLEGKLQASAGIEASRNILSMTNLLTGSRQFRWKSDTIEAVSFVSPIIFKDVKAGSVIVTVDQRPLENQLQTLTNALAATTFGLILIGIMLAFPLAHRLCKPIYQLVKAGEALDRGDIRGLITDERKDEIGRVLGSFRRMSEGIERKQKVERAFSRFVSPTIAHQVLNRPDGGTLGGVTMEGTVLFCDIVGFTELSEDLTPEEVGELLNDYFSYFSVAASSCQGTVDKFIGDCIMILFGVPEGDDRHAMHAVTCAVLIQEIAVRINYRRKMEGLPTVEFRIGLNSGQMLAGNLGGEERMQYTVVGDVVNLAARICALCDPGSSLMTEETLNQRGIDLLIEPIALKAVTVRGRRQQVTPYVINSAVFNENKQVLENLEQILPMEAIL